MDHHHIISTTDTRELLSTWVDGSETQIIDEPHVITDENGTIIVTSGSAMAGENGVLADGSPVSESGGAIGKQQKMSRRSQTEATRGALAEPNALRPATTKAGKHRIRMKWSHEVNQFIMRTYYTITSLETDTKAYRDSLHKLFNQQYPDVLISQQRIADQRRAIVKNNLLPTATLESIKEEVAQSLHMKHYPIVTHIKQEPDAHIGVPTTTIVTSGAVMNPIHGSNILHQLHQSQKSVLQHLHQTGHHHQVITTSQQQQQQQQQQQLLGHGHHVVSSSGTGHTSTTSNSNHLSNQSHIIIRVNTTNQGGTLKHHLVEEDSSNI